MGSFAHPDCALDGGQVLHNVDIGNKQEWLDILGA